MKNELIYEAGGGGDMFIQGNNIVTTDSIYCSIYLCLFGGNREASTKRDNDVKEIREDWWGNSVGESSKWINSETERVLTGITLTNSNLTLIKQAVEKDLKKLSGYGEFTVEVSFLGQNKLRIDITAEQIDGESDVSFVWDATKNEVILNKRV